MNHRLIALGLSLTVSLGALGACGGAPKLTPPPPPLRPKAVKVDKPVDPNANAPTDCEPTDPSKELPAKAFAQRSIPEANKLAQQALAKLTTAEGNPDKATRQMLITEAVDEFITALLADPYNVLATYNLAAAYARIKRPQCAVNLLVRLLQMKDHASRKADVEASIDRLLGRKKKQLDPDFNDMRSDGRFRDLIVKMCEGSSDPECVFGSAPRR